MDDFEAIFDSYDVLGVQTVPVMYLEHALRMVGVDNAKQVLHERVARVLNTFAQRPSSAISSLLPNTPCGLKVINKISPSPINM